MGILLNSYTAIEQFDVLPEGLLDISPEQLHSLISVPTLFHLNGKKKPALFVSVMLHGNEPSGFLAVQRLLRKYRQHELPRSLSLFFGNTVAARTNVRHLDEQPDFNRIWPGTRQTDCPEARWAEEIVTIMQSRGTFASIDVHNNTGVNPHYACVNKLDNDFLQLGALFGRLLVHFTHPKGVQSAAFAAFCPAVTLECGRPEQEYGIEHALEFIDSCLHLTEIPTHPVAKHNLDIYHTVAQVTVAGDIDFSFTDESADLCLNQDLERMNFTPVPPGTVLGKVNGNGKIPLIAKDEYGNFVTTRFFSIDNKQLTINRSIMPSMLTLNEKVIRQDCLCYLMERIPL
ncbi:MAG: M14 family metallopeptidase [Gammaproteobacteria bacterium]